jgi:hypothetical protein
MTTTNKIIFSVLALGLAFGAGYFTKPTKTVEVVKKEYVKEEAKTKVVYREKITKPDGTITETEHEREDTRTVVEAKQESSKVVENRVGLTLQALAYVPINDLTQRDYGVIVSKRVFSNVVVGAMATTDKKIGLTLGLEF